MSVRVEHGDARDVMRALADEGMRVDSVVCDPPYHLTSIVKRFGGKNAAPAQFGKDGAFARASAGFMGKQWDGGDIALRPETWALAAECMKPGAHLVAFGGTRTFHRMAVAIEDAGLEIRDTLSWLYGSGFPKSHNVGNGWGTALKPAWEPIILARKPLIGSVAENLAAHRTGAINVDGCRVPTDENLNGGAYAKKGGRASLAGDERIGAAQGMFQAGKTADHEYEQPPGRWPANVLHDGSEEVLQAFAAFGDRGQAGPEIRSRATPKTKGIYGQFGEGASRDAIPHDGPGSPARFFFSGKAGPDDRIGSKHPTVKPVALMRWLVRLVTPKGGLVLDPFAGTGTTGVACIREGMRAILIEREDEYVADIRRRLAMLSGLDTPLLAGAAD